MTTKNTVLARTAPENAIAPIVVNLGKVKRERIKKLQKGEGKLMEEVYQVLDQVRASLGERASGTELVPVVLVYEKKARRRLGLLGL